jgi:hypothetical protein
MIAKLNKDVGDILFFWLRYCRFISQTRGYNRGCRDVETFAISALEWGLQ